MTGVTPGTDETKWQLFVDNSVASEAATAANNAATAANAAAANYVVLLATIAPTFSASTSYIAGQYVWYNGTLYRFTADHAAGTWTGTDAAAVVVGEDISELKSAIGDYGYVIPSAYNSDLDNVKEGWVRYGSTATHRPDTSIGFALTVTRTSGAGVRQQIAITDSNEVYVRHMEQTQTWSAWIHLANSADMAREQRTDFGLARYTGAYPYLDALNFENGSLSSGGVNNDTYHPNARVRTKDWLMSAYDMTIEAEAESTDHNYRFLAYLKDSEESMPEQINWTKSAVMQKGKYYRLLMADAKFDTSTASISVENMLSHFKAYANSAYMLGTTDIVDRNTDAKRRLISLKRHTHNFGDALPGKHLTHSEMFAIGHISDVHVDGERYKHFIDFCDFYKNYIDARICTGDFISSPTDNSGRQATYMRDIESTKTVLWCCGNHERSGGSGSITQGDVYDLWQLGQWYEDTAVTTPAGVSKPLYYYKDYTKALTIDGVDVGYKIRLVVLNCCDRDSSGAVNVYGTEQVSWLTGVLQDAAANGLAVIIATHFQESKIIPGDDKTFYCRKIYADSTELPSTPVIENMIDDFRQGTGDFAQTGAGQFLAWLVGHSHTDRIGYSERHPDQLVLQVVNGGLHRTAYDTVSHNQTFHSDLPREEGERSEDAFNVYSFDPINKLCKVMRVGSDLNDMMIPRTIACFSTEPANN